MSPKMERMIKLSGIVFQILTKASVEQPGETETSAKENADQEDGRTPKEKTAADSPEEKLGDEENIPEDHQELINDDMDDNFEDSHGIFLVI